MGFASLIRKRYSVRSYQSRDIDDAVLQRVLQAFVLAPTAKNSQALGLVVVHTAGRTEELRQIYERAWFAAHPPLVVCVMQRAPWTT